MPNSIINADSGVTSGTTGLVTGGGDTGILEIQTNGVTAATVNASQILSLVNALPAGSGGTGLTSVGASGNVLTSNGTSWTSAAPVAGDPTTAQVLSANAGAEFGAVGTYALAVNPTATTGTFIEGNTYAGSGIFPAGIRKDVSDSTGTDASDTSVPAGLARGPTALSGTWRAMGRFGDSVSRRSKGTIFLRIS
jgi:hypothetical protein